MLSRGREFDLGIPKRLEGTPRNAILLFTTACQRVMSNLYCFYLLPNKKISLPRVTYNLVQFFLLPCILFGVDLCKFRVLALKQGQPCGLSLISLAALGPGRAGVVCLYLHTRHSRYIIGKIFEQVLTLVYIQTDHTRV